MAVELKIVDDQEAVAKPKTKTRSVAAVQEADEAPHVPTTPDAPSEGVPHPGSGPKMPDTTSPKPFTVRPRLVRLGMQSVHWVLGRDRLLLLRKHKPH